MVVIDGGERIVVVIDGGQEIVVVIDGGEEIVVVVVDRDCDGGEEIVVVSGGCGDCDDQTVMVVMMGL